MPIQRLTGVAALVSMLLLATPTHAETRAAAKLTLAADGASSQPLNQLPILNPAPQLTAPGAQGLAGMMPAFGAGHTLLAPMAPAAAKSDAAKPAAELASDPSEGNDENITDLRKSLIALAMHLRDVRYVRGGTNPNTGFDCSGFVRYVFAHAIGVQLPANSASQFLAGLKVKRDDMKPGDLVFFHTGGRHHRITHVGIYISGGRFIHAPTTGKSVQISSLSEAYWAKHFVGAKRPEGMLSLAASNG